MKDDIQFEKRRAKRKRIGEWKEQEGDGGAMDFDCTVHSLSYSSLSLLSCNQPLLFRPLLPRLGHFWFVSHSLIHLLSLFRYSVMHRACFGLTRPLQRSLATAHPSSASQLLLTVCSPLLPLSSFPSLPPSSPSWY